MLHLSISAHYLGATHFQIILFTLLMTLASRLSSVSNGTRRRDCDPMVCTVCDVARRSPFPFFEKLHSPSLLTLFWSL
ncbi:hypothetical protein B0H19DRAFT_714959 [Mycena capillaripes]|nr:hypothetical protein B0H19DRAFT_714959 [Mycena capillaripes]